MFNVCYSFSHLYSSINIQICHFEQMSSRNSKYYLISTCVQDVHVRMYVYVYFVIAGRNELRKDLSLKVKNERINSLCVADGASCRILRFQEARVLNPYLSQLWVISHKYQSDLFNVLWTDQIRRYQKHGPMDFVNVINLIWAPVFKHCTEIYDNLFSWQIKLVDVDRHFKRYSEDDKVLTREIRCLQLAVQENLGRDTTDLKWINSRVTKMRQHWELSSYADAARAFLRIRNTLKLTGDFTLVERVAAQVFIL